MAKTTRRLVTPFLLPAEIITRAEQRTRIGEKIAVSPSELIAKMMDADAALNGTSNDVDHDALAALQTLRALREWFSDLYEHPLRRVSHLIASRTRPLRP